MHYIIRRTTSFGGKDTVFYYVKQTILGPMFNLRNMAKEFDTIEEAEAVIEELPANLDGIIEIEEI